MIKYRLMEKKDIDAVFAINEASFSMPWTRTQIEQILSDEKMLYVVADLDDVVLGYCGMYRVLDEGNITQVAVSSDMRGRRIATAMMKTLISLAKDEGIHFFTLEVRLSNEPAISLYKKSGFVIMGRRKNYYSNPTEDGLIMNLE